MQKWQDEIVLFSIKFNSTNISKMFGEKSHLLRERQYGRCCYFKMKPFSILFLNLGLINWAYGFNGLTSLYNTHEEPYMDSDEYKSTIPFTVTEKWIQQKLDHFDSENAREWKMRYLENSRFFKPGE